MEVKVNIIQERVFQDVRRLKFIVINNLGIPEVGGDTAQEIDELIENIQREEWENYQRCDIAELIVCSLLDSGLYKHLGCWSFVAYLGSRNLNRE